MNNIPKISEAEWEVMKVLWVRSPLTSLEVVEALTGRSSWKPNTIKTLLARLVTKGAVHAEKSAREHSYSPAVSETDCVRDESRSFLRRVYEGATMPLIASLLQQEKLSRDEIAELRSLLDQMEKKKKTRK